MYWYFYTLHFTSAMNILRHITGAGCGFLEVIKGRNFIGREGAIEHHDIIQRPSQGGIGIIILRIRVGKTANHEIKVVPERDAGRIRAPAPYRRSSSTI